jgi:hypothetical protein
MQIVMEIDMGRTLYAKECLEVQVHYLKLNILQQWTMNAAPV